MPFLRTVESVAPANSRTMSSAASAMGHGRGLERAYGPFQGTLLRQRIQLVCPAPDDRGLGLVRDGVAEHRLDGPRRPHDLVALAVERGELPIHQARPRAAVGAHRAHPLERL